MDFEEKSLAEFAENDLRELFSGDYYVEAFRAANDLEFTSMLDNGLNNGLGVVLNDRLIAEASLSVISQSLLPMAHPASQKKSAPIKTEHSYSLCSIPPKSKEENLSDLDSECYPAIPIAEAEGSRTHNPLFCQESSVRLPVEVEGDTCSPVGMLQRHASTETLSCCGDCCRPEEDDLNLEGSLNSPFNLDDLDDISDEDIDFEDHLSFSLINSNVNNQQSRKSLDTSQSETSIHVISTSNTSTPMNCLTSASKLTCIKRESEEDLKPNVFSKEYFKIKPENLNLSKLDENNAVQHTSKHVRNNSLTSGRTDTVFDFPPTPPSYSSSDSDSSGGDQSPPRLCPLYETLSPNFWNPKKTGLIRTNRNPITTSLISSQPRGATGTLNLTEEEKRTLLSEGYPVPVRLPLTKAEEKSLKKIRRKIKNKISAQESRRKKKEYMDTLEQKVEVLEQQNKDYKKKVDTLQNKNNQLLEELHKLQNLVHKEEKSRTRSTTLATLVVSRKT